MTFTICVLLAATVVTSDSFSVSVGLLATSATTAAVLLWKNLSPLYARRACRSYPFVVCTFALTSSVVLDVAIGENAATSATALIVVASGLLHLSSRRVHTAVAVFAVFSIPAAMSADVVFRTLAGRDRKYVQVWAAEFTDLSIRRSVAVTLVTTLLLSLLQNAQSGTAHACLALAAHARHKDLLASAALGAPPLALSRVRAALGMRRMCAGPLAGPADATPDSAVTAAAWRACERLAAVDARAIALMEWSQRRTKLIVTLTAVVATAYISASFVPPGPKIVLSVTSLLVLPAPIYLMLGSNLSPVLVRSILRSTTCLVTSFWLAVILATNAFRTVYLLRLGHADDAVVVICYSIVLFIFIAAVIVHPAMVARVPVLEGALAAIGMLTQANNVLFTLDPTLDFTLVTLRTGFTIRLSDIRRTAFAQLFLCLVRIALVSVVQAVRHARSRVDATDGFVNSSFVVPLPKEGCLDAYAVHTVRSIVSTLLAKPGGVAVLEGILPEWPAFAEAGAGARLARNARAPRAPA